MLQFTYYSVSFQLILLVLLQVCPTTKSVVVGNIKIVGQSGGIPQFLPGSYINTIPRWSVEYVTTPNSENENEDEQSKSSISLKRLIGTGIQDTPQEPSSSSTSTIAQEFVNPTSNEELWWPSDLETIQIRPTLDIFMKTAIPTYLLAGLEVRVPSTISKDGKVWKNFGMNSQPIATQWTSFGVAVENGFRVESFVGKVQVQESASEDGEDSTSVEETKGDGGGNDDEVEWEPLYSIGNEDKSCHGQKNDATKGTANAIQILGNLLASMDEMSPLANGMHIVSIPINERWIDLNLNLLSLGNLKDNEKMKIVSLGTVEPDAMEMLNVDDSLLDMSATSLLDVDLSAIAPGSESEYIPEVYKPLYIE